MSIKNNQSRWFWFAWLSIVLVAVVLRFLHLSSTPPSPYWEEVALGYDAFSLLKTGKDHHGHVWPVVAFESFGDWKPAGYYYALLPFIATMELSVTAIRMPAALAGVLIVIGVGWLARLLSQWWRLDKEWGERWQLIAMAITAVSPWAILFSRAAWEVNLATGLVVWGVGCAWQSWLKARDKKNSNQDVWWMAGAAVLLVLSMYTYHAARLISPLLGLGLGATWMALTWSRPTWPQVVKRWVIAVVPAVIIAVPLLLALGSPVTSQRFAETSIFSDVSVIERSNELQAMAGHSWWSKIVYHRYVLFGQVIVVNFFSHFTPQFLFLTGDNNPRHSIQFLGQLYPFEIFFLLAGAIWLAYHYRFRGWFIWWWIVIGVVPASITLASPHALRTLFVMPVLMLLISAGILHFIVRWSHWLSRWLIKGTAEKIVWLKIAIVYLLGVGIFWRFYVGVYSQLYSSEWQAGYEEMVRQVADFESAHPDTPIYITREQGRPAMYYWFYTQTDPTLVQAAAKTAKQDQGEFLEFENLTFVRSVDEVTNPGLVVSSEAQAQRIQSKYDTQSLFSIKDAQNHTVWIGTLVE